MSCPHVNSNLLTSFIDTPATTCTAHCFSWRPAKPKELSSAVRRGVSVLALLHHWRRDESSHEPQTSVKLQRYQEMPSCASSHSPPDGPLFLFQRRATPRTRAREEALVASRTKTPWLPGPFWKCAAAGCFLRPCRARLRLLKAFASFQTHDMIGHHRTVNLDINVCPSLAQVACCDRWRGVSAGRGSSRRCTSVLQRQLNTTLTRRQLSCASARLIAMVLDSRSLL